ncbi:hypothetical protein A9Q99_24600 [Gammaproteobacteria bacterium 45_16_T64]|nr:hypothetical protein A9Q99_24600 [Gammaproteobacteria bacterium 45_16_T64]
MFASSTQESISSPFISEKTEANQQLIIKYVLHEAGVYDLLRQMPDLITQEIVNLKASAMPLTEAELAQLRLNLKGRLQTSEMKQSIVSYLQSRMSESELLAVKRMLQAPNVMQFKQLQEDADNEVAHGHMRSYKVQLQENAPNKSRVALVERLDTSLGQTRLETGIKVELRKNLLANVSWMKSSQVLPENVLEKELAEYRERVGGHINENARVFYLYLFKKTPSKDIRGLISRYSNPEFETFMENCEGAILNSFKKARRDAYSETTLAGN